MLVSQDKLPAYLFGSLRYAGIAWRARPKLLESSLKDYRRVTSRGYYHLPFYFIYDLHALIHLGFEASFASDADSLTSRQDDTATLCGRYEREVLGRLLQSPDFSNALEIISTAKKSAPMANRLLLLLTERFQALYPSGPIINPAQIRDLEIPPQAEIQPEAALEELGDLGTKFVPALQSFLDAVGDQIRWGQLLRTEDFFELTHLEVLKDEHLRIGCRQIVQFNRDLTQDSELKLDLSNHETEADTTFLDETHYPSGGLTGLTNRGSFENLVMSELIYLDEAEGGISLFNLRYVEGELLFYLRDSGILRRKRRTIHLILDLGALFHVKSAAHRYQYSVLAQGLCLRLLQDFFEIFETDSLRFALHYLPTGEPDKLEEEQQVMRLLLHDYVQHGWVKFHNRKALHLSDLTDPKRKSYAVVLTQSGHLDNWQAQKQRLEDEDVPLYCTLLALDATTAPSFEDQRMDTLRELLA